MDVSERIEKALEGAFARAAADAPPPKLVAAMRHAVFPGGARVRPQLCLAVAEACGGDAPELTDAAAAAIELLHCASLVHDDLPCFDDAPTRRDQPSVQAAYGEALAVLAGDALIVLAFETLVIAGANHPQRLSPLHAVITRAVGMPSGIIAGQAWESEPDASPEAYRRAKTGSLFVAATVVGAIAAGVDADDWRALGQKLGEAYQVADDLLDTIARAEDADKPVGRDAALGRPNTVAELGVPGAVARLESLIAAAIESIPPCRGAAALRELVGLQARRLAPKRLLRSAA
ncbi:MAG: polyprenyl synthetase family protein [Rhodospirillaceae bacterium]|nr:polyprenyl synthetase family protein [Rhodospirillaceae bacterium]